jgi:hypothetical protein
VTGDDFEASDGNSDPADAGTDDLSGLLLSEEIDATHPGLAPVADIVMRWWSAKPPDGLPPRSAFPADEWGDLFGMISVVEPVDGGRDFRYRIHAGTVATIAGLDLTGKFLSDLPYADYREELIRLSAEVMENGEPGFRRMKIMWMGSEYDYVRVALPVIADDLGTQVISAFLHTDPEKPKYQSRFVSGGTS